MTPSWKPFRLHSGSGGTLKEEAKTHSSPGSPGLFLFGAPRIKFGAMPVPRVFNVVEFMTSDGDVLVISIPRSEAHVVRHFQERMPYGLFVPDVSCDVTQP